MHTGDMSNSGALLICIQLLEQSLGNLQFVGAIDVIVKPWITMNVSVKEPNKFHNYETQKIAHKASDSRIYRVVWFFHPRSSCI